MITSSHVMLFSGYRVFLKNRHGKKLSSRCQVSKENGCVYLNSTVRMAFSGLKVKMNT